MANIRPGNLPTRRAVLMGGASAMAASSQSLDTKPERGKTMDLGAFSVSLAVKNLAASKEFYEKLGFKSFAGDGAKFLILKNGDATIGLFQGMFQKNMLTFNPGWDRNAQKKPEFLDVRKIQRELKANGITFAIAADENTKGPASFIVIDPDGNPILVDQHV